jgi:hypothetical protein
VSIAVPAVNVQRVPTKMGAGVSYVMASVGKADFVGKSGWLFQQVETGKFEFVLMTGCQAAGYLLVESENNVKSIQFLTDLGNERYALADILTVAVEEDEGQFIATEPRRGWYGYGASQDEAVKHFTSALVEDFEVLSEREDRLSPSLRNDLAQLRKVVVPRR